MAYAQQTDLLQIVTMPELIQLTDDDNLGQVDASKVTGALTEASGIIDGYCRTRYQVPLQQSNEAVGICRDIAIYLLFSRRRAKMADTIRQRYEDAMALLKAISTGTAQLDQAANAPPQTSVATAVKPSRSNLRFGECNIEGFN